MDENNDAGKEISKRNYHRATKIHRPLIDKITD